MDKGIVKSSLLDLVLYFIKLGATGFGGPIALVASMQKDLVEERNWFSQGAFKEGMALAQLAPGPLATQVAIYLGWFHSGILGATLVGILFVLPSFLMVVAIAILYIQYGSLPFIQKLFHGIGPAVIGIICIGAHKLAKRNLGRSWDLWTIAIINAVIVGVTKSEIIWVFLLSGLFLVVLRSKIGPKVGVYSFFPMFVLSGLNGEAAPSTLVSIFTFFLRAGAFVFGSGLAIVPFLHAGVTVENHWLTEAQFLDAVAVAMITPGPVVITVAFIGFLVAGFVGASLAALGTFLPCYFFTIIPAPYFSRISKTKHLKEFIGGITAAAIGAILGAAFILGRQSLANLPSVLIFALTLLGLLFIKKVPEPAWILIAGGIGCLL